MCHSNDCDVALHFLSQRLLYNRVCLVICPRQPESEQFLLIYDSQNLPIADVASSRIKSLLCLRIALARATICLCPTDKFAPPPAIFVSNVTLLPSSTCCCRENRPAERRESFMVASSYCPKGSKLYRRVPLMSSGYGTGH